MILQSAGAFAVGGFIDRSATLVWPTGTNGDGQFEFAVSTDATSAIFENNASDTGEANNRTALTVNSGPDLVIRNLRVEQSSLQAGGLVTLLWRSGTTVLRRPPRASVITSWSLTRRSTRFWSIPRLRMTRLSRVSARSAQANPAYAPSPSVCLRG